MLEEEEVVALLPPTRDLVDSLTDAWRTQIHEQDRGEHEFVKRAARLGVLLEDRMSEALAPWGLKRSDYGVLSTLRLMGPPYELRPTDLKARLLLTSGGISNVLNRLAAAGYLLREKDLDDGRSSWVRLTAMGLRTAEEIIAAWVAVQRNTFSEVSLTELHRASESLRSILLALGDREVPPASHR